MVDLKEDFSRVPCIRNALLYGLGGGIGIGAVRFFGSGRKLWCYRSPQALDLPSTGLLQAF